MTTFTREDMSVMYPEPPCAPALNRWGKYSNQLFVWCTLLHCHLKPELSFPCNKFTLTLFKCCHECFSFPFICQAPVVSRSDCTEIECVTEELFFEYENGEMNIYVSNVDIEFNACQGLNEDDDNDLFAYYERLVDEGLVEDQTAQVLEHIVGDDQCPDAIKDFLTEKIDSLGLLD